MTTTTDSTIHIELKYCELCGALFFRRQQNHQTLCAPCITRPNFLLRECTPATPPEPPAQQQAAWYGPMTDTIHRLDAVAERGTCDLVPVTSPCDLRILTTFDVRPSTFDSLPGGAA